MMSYALGYYTPPALDDGSSAIRAPEYALGRTPRKGRKRLKPVDAYDMRPAG